MPIRDALLPEFDQELKVTRAVLAALPERATAFRPHPKSWTAGELSLHIANLPAWLVTTLTTRELDLTPPGGPGWTPPAFESQRATLAVLDQNAAAARARLAATDDADFALPWSLKSAGQVLFTMPRVACVRGFVLNHLIHHRGQLSVYLRLCDVPVPSIYGPTADTPV